MSEAATLPRLIEAATGARRARRGDVVQTLWSGYGEIVRYRLEGAAWPSVIVKHVIFPSEVDHPRGWHDDHAHQRKVRSYQVEMQWYAGLASHCDEPCRVPACHVSRTIGEEHVMILEDLDAAGFPARHEQPGRAEIRRCLDWLAHFHARFLNHPPEGLWPVGSYWHLETRRQEWQAIADPALREAAEELDRRLNAARFQTLIHGDAKVANFCFAADGQRVAAVDFQYTGGGGGIKDVAYFLGSGLAEHEQPERESELLDHYFASLRAALSRHQPTLDTAALETEWRELFPIAQADFHRFLAGWSPTHWKINDHLQTVTERVIAGL